MIKFYQEFPDFEKVATLSQQLTWSQFVEILPMQDELKRDFYAAMCMQERRIKIFVLLLETDMYIKRHLTDR